MPIATDTMGRLNETYSTARVDSPPQGEIKWISAVECIEQEIETGIFIFEKLKRNAESAQAKIDSGEIEYDPRITESFASHFFMWAAKGDLILEEVRLFEQNKVPIRNADELRNLIAIVRLQNFDMNRQKASAGSLTGRRQSLSEAINALRTRLQ